MKYEVTLIGFYYIKNKFMHPQGQIKFAPIKEIKLHLQLIVLIYQKPAGGWNSEAEEKT